jgi:hypothetical protein
MPEARTGRALRWQSFMPILAVESRRNCECRLNDFGCERMRAIGYWLLAIGYWLLANEGSLSK